MNRADIVLRESGPRGLRLAVSILGPVEAPPVLVLHGITASRRYWLPRICLCATSYRLFVPDLPGFGASPKPVTDYTMPFFVETVLGLLERHGLFDRPVRIVAHSLGALVGLGLAALPGRRVERLVLLNVPRFRDARRGAPRHARRILVVPNPVDGQLAGRELGAAPPHRMEADGPEHAADSVGRARGRAKFSFRSLSSTVENCLLHYRVDGVLARIPPDVPILFVHGDQDLVAPLRAIEELCHRRPDPRSTSSAAQGTIRSTPTPANACPRSPTSSLDERGRFPNRGFGDTMSLSAKRLGVPKSGVWETSPFPLVAGGWRRPYIRV